MASQPQGELLETAPWPASSATSRASSWSPCAPARRWPSWRRCWPSAASACPSSRRTFAGRRRGTCGRHGGAPGLSGPARASAGSVRDYVLGLTMVNGRGELLTFGGQVMKNVAGYDVSRLVAGSLGTLGLITEVSLKVLPVAPAEATLKFEMSQAEALRRLNDWGGQPLPLNASCWVDDAGVPTLYPAPARRRRGGRGGLQDPGRRTPGQRRRWPRDWALCRDQRLPWFERARRARPVAPVGAADRAGARPARAAAGRVAWRPALGARRARRRRPAARGGRARGRPRHACSLRRGDRPRPRPAASRRWRRRWTASTASSSASSTRPASSTAAACTRISESDRDANPSLPRIQGHARRPGGRGHPAQVRALRLLHRHLPHLPDAGRRARRPARPHLPDQAGAGRRSRRRARRSCTWTAA